MELRQYLHIVRKRLWLIVVGALLAGGLAYVLTPQLPPTYRASTSLYVRASSAGSDAHARMLVNRYLSATYRELLTRRPILETAGLNLNLAPSDIAKLADKVTVWVVADTSVIRLATLWARSLRSNTSAGTSSSPASKAPEVWRGPGYSWGRWP